MITSNYSLDSLSVKGSLLPPQHQNLAPPPLEMADTPDSVLLSAYSPNKQLPLENLGPPDANLAQPWSSQTSDLENRASSETINQSPVQSQTQPQVQQETEPTLAAESEARCRSRPNAYSAATAATHCAFSCEGAPALLFQEDFYTTIGAEPLSLGQERADALVTDTFTLETPTAEFTGSARAPNSTRATESASATEPARATESTSAMVSARGDSFTTEASSASSSLASSTGPKAEAKKPPAAEEPPSPAEERALQEEKEQQEKLRVEVIYDRIKAEKLLHEAKRQAIWADLQTELRRIWREVMLRRKKSEDDYQKSWQKLFLNAG